MSRQFDALPQGGKEGCFTVGTNDLPPSGIRETFSCSPDSDVAGMAPLLQFRVEERAVAGRVELMPSALPDPIPALPKHPVGAGHACDIRGSHHKKLPYTRKINKTTAPIGWW